MSTGPFNPNTQSTYLVGTSAVQVPGGQTSYRIRNLLSTTQYIAWGTTNGVTVTVPTAGVPQVNTIGMIGPSVEVFGGLPANVYFIANAVGAFEVTPGDGMQGVMPVMPNVVGLELPAAHLALQGAGVLNPASLGYFGQWPISVSWSPVGSYGAIAGIALAGTVTAGGGVSSPGLVLTQAPTAGSAAAANSPVALSVGEYPTGVAYP